MPIYEYECDKCHKRTSVLTLRVSEKIDAACRHCGGKKLSRLMSRFAMPKSEESRLESMADPSNFGDVDESDPKSVARMMRKIGKEMGEDFNGEDFDQAIDEIERGGDKDDEFGGGGGSDDSDDF
jgi:putative FmdB family regulatory protein